MTFQRESSEMFQRFNPLINSLHCWRSLSDPLNHNSFHVSLYQFQAYRRQSRADDPKENATLYHVFPHNQHLFQLPECASQQVCNAVYLRLNFSTPLCACPEPGDPCSASTLATDNHSLRCKWESINEMPSNILFVAG